MNVEQAYVKTNEQTKTAQIVEKRINACSEAGLELNLKLVIPNSYGPILANDNKRKVAISFPSDGWLSILESKEVNDYYMLIIISEELQTEVFAIIQSDITGSWGFVEIMNGKIQNTYFSEADDEIEYLIEQKLDEKGIHQSPCMFREAVKDKRWIIAAKKTTGN